MQNLHSTQDPAAFQPDEHAKHKYVNDSEDDRNDQKGNKKKGKQGQKRKAQMKATPSEENVKKTKLGKGKGVSKKCTHAQPSSTSTPPSSQGHQGQGTSTPTSIQGAQGQPTSTPSSTQGAQSSPYGPQVPDAHEKVIVDNEVAAVVLYQKSMHLCYRDKYKKEWNARFMRHLHNMLFHMKTYRKYHNKQGKLVIPKVHTNAYFSFRSLDCLKLVHDGIDYCDLYMGNYYFNQLTPENVTILKQKGYWEPILANWKPVSANGPSVLL